MVNVKKAEYRERVFYIYSLLYLLIGTVHLCSTVNDIEKAFTQSNDGYVPQRPLIEMTIPSSLDVTIAPKGSHVVQLFVQFTPFSLKNDSWEDAEFKKKIVERCLSIVEEYISDFKASIVGMDVLSPLDLERTFGMLRSYFSSFFLILLFLVGLYGGSIHHGSLSLHQLYAMRPAPGYSGYRMPLKGDREREKEIEKERERGRERDREREERE